MSELEQLTELAEAIARADALDELVDTVVERALPLLAARACHVYLLDPGSEELERRASAPDPGSARATLGPRRARARARARRPEHAGRGAARRERRAHRPARGRRQHAGRARPRDREPGRGRDQEGAGDRAAHREEPHQGLLRDARGRRARAATSRGAPHASAATSTRRTSSSSRSRRTTRWSARCAPLRPDRSSTAARTRCARS